MITINKKIIIAAIFITFLNFAYGRNTIQDIIGTYTSTVQKNNDEYSIDSLYKELKLEGKLSKGAFRNGVLGFNNIQEKKKNILTIIDYSESSLQDRFFVIDLNKKDILFSTTVAHGKNSGGDIPTKFSNKIDSYQSSPGFYITEGTYSGQNGYSLILDGLEKGINDKAKERNIVVHGASYAKPYKGASRLGRSLGCPAIPKEITKPVIDTIKDGSIIYIYTDKIKS